MTFATRLLKQRKVTLHIHIHVTHTARTKKHRSLHYTLYVQKESDKDYDMIIREPCVSFFLSFFYLFQHHHSKHIMPSPVPLHNSNEPFKLRSLMHLLQSRYYRNHNVEIQRKLQFVYCPRLILSISSVSFYCYRNAATFMSSLFLIHFGIKFFILPLTIYILRSDPVILCGRVITQFLWIHVLTLDIIINYALEHLPALVAMFPILRSTSNEYLRKQSCTLRQSLISTASRVLSPYLLEVHSGKLRTTIYNFQEQLYFIGKLVDTLTKSFCRAKNSIILLATHKIQTCTTSVKPYGSVIYYSICLLGYFSRFHY